MAIHAVAHGGAFLDPGLAKSLVRSYIEYVQGTREGNASEEDVYGRGIPLEGVLHPHLMQNSDAYKPPAIAQELQRLTPREMEVLKLVAEGCTNQEIADLLVLSIKTVQAHRANVMEKLELQDITHLVRFAIRHGLIPVDT